MKCPVCGKEISDTARFCNGCGTPVPAVTVATAPEVPVEPVREEEKKKDRKPLFFLLGALLLVVAVGYITYLLIRNIGNTTNK